MTESKPEQKNVLINRYFTAGGDTSWEVANRVMLVSRRASVKKTDGTVLYDQVVMFPAEWSDQAVNITASKYFGVRADGTKEFSLRQLIERVVSTISAWGAGQKLFDQQSERVIFEAELMHILFHQKAAFNSPVWFNLGLPNRRQAVSACYIQSIDDSMESIMELYQSEARLFCDGSGSGTNFSKLRASGEALSGGGASSGPMAFIQGLDAASGAIKSGGKTRRAAKMVILNADHPDVEEFVECKSKAEDMAAALVAAGFSGDFSDPASVYASLPFQNANNSVRVTDKFMEAVRDAGTWNLVERKTGKVRVIQARDLWKKICEAAWRCGDPGLQFHDTINDWHTCPFDGRINASNPCSEYMFLDDSACNLASINLMKIGGTEDMSQVVRVMITAMEAMVTNADYPTQKIRQNSVNFRPLGLGYANLGAKLMSMGIPYDSDSGRIQAAEWTKEMQGIAYMQSARLAERLGPFMMWKENESAFLRVLQMHGLNAAQLNYIKMVGLRNAQISVLAPTGTIGFLMDCDTTGIEPCLALTTYKKLVGGGSMQIINRTALAAAATMGCNADVQDDPDSYFDSWLSSLPEYERRVFDCALPDSAGRSIAPEGHVKMMAAVQPYLSGAISKTVNLPSAATVEDVSRIYMEAWELGLKAIAVYRDGCKSSQPASATAPKGMTPELKNLRVIVPISNEFLNDTGMSPEEIDAVVADIQREQAAGFSKKLSDTRQSLTHKFKIGGHTGFVTVGLFDDGSPGEMFVCMSKQGSMLSGLMDAWAITMSIALQNGVPFDSLAEHLAYVRFEPSGWTGSKEIPQAFSVIDYIVRWIAATFFKEVEVRDDHPIAPSMDDPEGDVVEDDRWSMSPVKKTSDAPICRTCGTLTERAGSCYRCPGCGETTGCS